MSRKGHAEQPVPLGGFLLSAFFFYLLFIYMAAPGLSCGMQTLNCHIRKLVP